MLERLSNARNRVIKIGLIIFLSLVFSIFMAQGWYGIEQAEAAPITVINQFNTTPCGTGTTGATTSNITCTTPAIGAGSNRVVVLVITGEAQGNHNPASGAATYGAASFTEVQNSYGNNDNRRYVWMGYINESQIAANAGSNFSITLTSSASWVAAEATYAVYDTVDQTTPLSGSIKADSPNTSTTVSMGPITTVMDGMAIYSISANATTGNTTVPVSYTEHVDQVDNSGANYFVTIGSRTTLPGTSESVSMTAVNARWTSAFMALTPAAAGSPGTLQLNSSTYSVNENGTSVTITATRTGGSAGAASVNYATGNGTATAGSDYTASSGTLNWADGDSADKTFTVNIANDATVEGNETFNATLSGVSGASLGTPSSATVTIVDDDAASAGTLQYSSSTYSVNENGTSVTITVTRTGGSSGAVGVSYSTTNGTATAGSDYTSASGSLSWADGDIADKTFAVNITDDGTVEGNEAFSTSLATPTGGASLGTPNTATVTIVDNDGAPPAVPAGNAILLGILFIGISLYGLMKSRKKGVQ